jgi:hypothetical protein
MSDLWRSAEAASTRFASQAVAYDHHRPRYPEQLFDRLMDRARLSPGAAVLEVGAGTGIATKSLVERGLRVTAVEPASELASLTRAKVGDRATVVEDRFEQNTLCGPVALVAAFNAWHWGTRGRPGISGTRLGSRGVSRVGVDRGHQLARGPV